MFHSEIVGTGNNTVRTMEVHQGKKGWYFTVHYDRELIYTSLELEDRAKVTEIGIRYLDTLNKVNHTARDQNE